MTKQQAAQLKKQWHEVTFYVVSNKSNEGAVIGPGFKAFWLADAWLRICKLRFPTADHTFVAHQPAKVVEPAEPAEPAKPAKPAKPS